MVKGAVGAILGGVLGAAAWAAIGYFAHAEVGYVAWGIGVLVGIGAVTLGGKGELGMSLGIFAGIVAALAVAGGKFAIVYLDVRQQASQAMAPVEAEEAKVELASEVARQYQSQGKPLAWPAGVDPQNASQPQNFPADLWQDVEKRWEAMGEPAQRALLAQMTADRRAHVDKIKNQVTIDAFKSSFSGFDLLWFGLAVLTAFRMASGTSRAGSRAPSP
jgi:hypothetical protein